MNRFDVQIVERKTKEVVESMGPFTLREAELTQRGALINISPDYKVEINLARYSIGAVGFGEPCDKNSAGWKRTHHIGDERVAMLQLVLDGKSLPEPYFLVGDNGGGGADKIYPSQINWETSGLKMTVSK